MAEQKASWVKAKPEDIKKIVVELGKENLSPEQIGLKLRDEHGIPTVKIFKIKIKKILEEAGIPVRTEAEGRERKIENLKKHFEKNKHDYKAQRSLVKNVSLINRAKKVN